MRSLLRFVFALSAAAVWCAPGAAFAAGPSPVCGNAAADVAGQSLDALGKGDRMRGIALEIQAAKLFLACYQSHEDPALRGPAGINAGNFYLGAVRDAMGSPEEARRPEFLREGRRILEMVRDDPSLSAADRASAQRWLHDLWQPIL